MACSGPVVLLEVQMHPGPGFRHRLAAQSSRFLQKHPQVEHLEVVVITPYQRMSLGPTRLPRLLQALLNEPRPPAQPSSRQILASRPDLDTSKSW